MSLLPRRAESGSRIVLTAAEVEGVTAAPVVALPVPWFSISAFGVLILLIALADIAMTWYPVDFGNPEWEFGTVAVSAAGLPLAGLGLGVTLSAAFGLRSRLWMRLLGFGSLLVAVLLLGTFLLFLTDVPLAMSNVPAPGRQTMLRLVARTTIYTLGFASIFTIAGVTAIRHSSFAPKPTELSNA